MMNCKEVAKLVSEMKDRDLPWQQRLSVRFHLMMCKMCKTYRAQLEFISRLARAAGDVVMNRPDDRALSPAAKQRIRQRLTEPD